MEKKSGLQIAFVRRQVLSKVSEWENSFEAKAITDRLLEYYTGKDPFFILTNPLYEVDESVVIDVEKALESLKKGMPLQYLLSEAWFYGNPYYVNSNTLIPRPETEELVNWALTGCPADFDGKGIDICCGTACIAVSMALMRPKSHWQCVDLFPETLETAEKNIRRYEVNVESVRKDVLDSSFVLFGDNDYDIAICNPPYVMESERNEISSKVKDFEPASALFVPDNNPLLFYHAVAGWAVLHIRKGGALFFEINEKLGNETVQLLKSYQFSNLELRKDMRNKARMVKAII